MEVQKLFLFTLLLLIFHFPFSTPLDNIAINQTIQDGTLLISKESNFALGFFSPGNSKNRYLGIWYYKVSKQTVVWVANRNYPINDSSGVLSINQYGNLILYSNHNQNFPVWSTNVSLEISDTYKAQLLDSGNLVLVQYSSKRIVWQSFDYPTDTHLPSMKIGLNRKTGVRHFLTSWRSADDPATGDYSVRINPNGLPQAIVYKGTKPCWRSMTWPLKNYEDFRNTSFVINPDEISVIYSPVDSVIARTVLDYSGLVKHQTWHESEGEWKEFWSAPKYQCDSYGHCGRYSKCDPLQVNRRFECDCLPGYEPQSPRDWNILRDTSSGCVKKRQQSSSTCMNEEGFVKVKHVKVPDASERVWLDMNMSPTDCEKECKRNCSCSAYAIINVSGKKTACVIWFGELIDIVDNVDEGTDIYVRVDAIELAEIKQNSNGFLGRKDILAISVSVVSAWFVVILFAYLWHKKKKKRAKNKWKKRLLDMDALAANEAGGSMSHQDIAFFSLRTILSATENFSPANKLGQGGFGSVYKGQLSNGQEIAVKRLSRNSSQGIEEFKNEVMSIAKLQHKNLVKLLGCCIEEEEPVLIYEYLPNKSLDSFLFDATKSSILDWRKRLDIIVGIARGILYIHQDSRLRIIHRDIKTSNILLDAEMNPKISDFGLARIFKGDQIQGKTNRIAGTFGYMPPEYVVYGKFSAKSDVFSYGVMLLEIITGKKNSDFFQEESSLSLIQYVWELWKEDRTMEIVDSSLLESNPCSNEVLRCIQIGLLCVQEVAVDRPTMLEVVLMLNSETTLPSPNQPAFVFRKQSNNFNNAVREEFCSANEVTISKVTSR